MSKSSPATKTILVVEDERLVAKDLQRSLSSLGYSVPVTAASAEDAIRIAAGRVPDLVLMDIHIRGDLDGIETAKILRSHFDVPVVYLTAYADKETVARATTTEPFGYLVKPVSDDALRSAVEIALHKHEMDRRLRDRERHFASTLRSIGEAVISTDASGHVSFMNPVAEVLTGWRREDAKGRPLAEVAKQVEELSRAPILDEKGSQAGTVIVLRDSSEERRLQRQMELADRLASLGTMAAGVAHEVNNPLAYIVANLQFVMAELRSRFEALGSPAWLEEVDHALEDAHTGAQKIKKIVADLHSFAMPASSRADRSNLRAVLEWAIQVTRHELDPKARVVVSLGPLPDVRGDEVKLGQVFINLLINAGQAIEPGNPDANEIAVHAAIEGESVVVMVRDTGSGMAPEVVNRVFDPFFTTRGTGRGTGLGLAICHGMVTSVGGDIAVTSAPGKGSSFRVMLPVASPVFAAPARSSRTPPPVRGELLVIDDEPLMRTVLQRALGAEHDLTIPESSVEGLELLKSGRRFDLILCDLMMPDLNGMDFYEEVLRLDADQAKRMLFISGGAFTTRAIEFLRSFPDNFVEKPFDPADLRRRVATLLTELGTRTS